MPGIVLTQNPPAIPSPGAPAKGNRDKKPVFISWEDLIFVTDLIVAGGERNIFLSGSDPLAHPHFVDIAAYLLERGCHVSVMTSGESSEEIIEDFKQIDSFLHKDRVNFLCDVTEIAHGRASEADPEILERFFRTLHSRVTPWITLENLSFGIEKIVSLINIFNLRRTIRISIGQPGESEGRSCLEPDQVKDALARLFSQAELLDAFRVKLDFDCGFLACCYSDEQLAYMVRNIPGFSISPCTPDVTVGPDMTMWSCRQLPGFSRRSILDFNHFNEIRQFYHDQHFAVRFESSGAFIDCDTCMLREDMICSGGCIAPILPRFRVEHPYSVAKNPLRKKEVFE